jgi:putative FmdB family regulatory protein
MPTYEYECKSCGYVFDAFQSMSDPVLTTCPECGKEVRRLINGGSGIIFKGSGFYVTDKGGNKSSSTSGGSDKKKGKPEVGKAESTSSAAPAPTLAEKAVG